MPRLVRAATELNLREMFGAAASGTAGVRSIKSEVVPVAPTLVPRPTPPAPETQSVEERCKENVFRENATGAPT